jgi:hypothetical protein
VLVFYICVSNNNDVDLLILIDTSSRRVVLTPAAFSPIPLVFGNAFH